MKSYLYAGLLGLSTVLPVLGGIYASNDSSRTSNPLELEAPSVPMPSGFEDVMPAAPKKKKGGMQVSYDAPDPEPVVTGSTEVLADSLTGVVFAAREDLIIKEGIRDAEQLSWEHDGVSIEGFVPPDLNILAETIEPYLGQPVSQRKINEMIRDVILFYREAGRPFVDIYLPEQAFRNSIVQIVVTESVLGEVRTEGNEYFEDWQMINRIGLDSGEIIDSAVIDEDIAAINSNPFRLVEAIYEKGSAPGTTDLILKTEDMWPFRFTFGFNDTGSKLTDYERYTAGVMWGRPFFLRDDLLNYSYTTSHRSSRLKAHSLTYTVSLPWHHTLTAIGSYADSSADFDTTALGLDGTSWTLGLRYTAPLHTNATLPYTDITFMDVLTFGYDFKRSDNTILFNIVDAAQVAQPQPITDISEFLVNYTVTIPQETGMISLGSQLTWHPGDMGGRNTQEVFTSAGYGPNDFWYLKFTGNYIRQLPEDFTLSLRGDLQMSSDVLPGSEKYGAGGSSSVRGYDNREANGDEGYLVSAEIRTPPYSLLQHITVPDRASEYLKDDQLQALLFMDFAETKTRNTPTSGADEHATLWSVGPGVRYNIGQYMTLSFDFGFQLTDTNVAEASRKTRNQRAHFSLNFSL